MSFSSMPTGAKATAGVAGMGGVSLLLYRILPPQMLYYVMIGTLLLGVAMGLLYWLVAKFRKRRAKPMEKSLRDNSAATPQGVTEPGRRARMDDLRKTFEDGVDKFKAAGKNLYSLPWYVLVGEPGSGKTEAVRHCNVGFPPGLQDQLQGVGGTINMNWWFTNHAVILDTAGRLMFEEIEAGASGEWREFLKLLRANRPNCPINGLLLCIPADSLIKDTADELERKGAKIAQQLDQIQRALGVRFPVFVMVTKCDLINGFREFFEDITDPQLQHQMMGWSNPAPLDEAFNPELVTDHLQTVSQRLVRRRLGLMLDPVNTEDPSGRRTDQVDAMYAFPQAMMSIAPRLRRYLEMIFVAGEWSAKPLFLRGIYFTSSMREGAALDAELAEVLGVPVESLPEGKVWERDRAYFLRDLFMNKVFREKGLVTNATNAKGRQRRRKIVILAAGFLSVVALSLFTWWGYRNFRNSIGAEAEYWLSAADDRYWIAEKQQWMRIVAPTFSGSTDYNYTGAQPIKMPSGDDVTTAKFHHDTMEMVRQPIPLPWIFRFAAVFGDDINEKRRAAQRVLYEASVLRPLIEGSRARMSATKQWSPKATEVLAQLIDLEAQSAFALGDKRVDSNGLFAWVLEKGSGYEDYRTKDAASLDEVMAWTYGEGGQAWPPKSLAPHSPAALASVDYGVDEFIKYWQVGGGIESGEILEAISALTAALKSFGQAEGELVRIDDPYLDKPNEPELLESLQTMSGRWRTRYEAALAESRKINDAVVSAKLGVKTLKDMYDLTIEKQMTGAKAPHEKLISSARPKAASTPGAEAVESAETKRQKKHLSDAAVRIEASLAGLEQKLQQSKLREEILELDPRYLQTVSIEDEALRRSLKAESLRLYELRLKMYETANLHLAMPAEGASMAGLAGAVGAVVQDAKQRKRLIDELAALEMSGYLIDQAAGVSTFVNDRLAQRKRIHTLIKHVLENAPKTASDVAAKVTQTVQQQGLAGVPRPVIPGTNFKSDEMFPAKYHPKAAAATFAGWKTIARYVLPAAGAEGAGAGVDVINRQELADLYRARQDAYNAYLAQYQEYWIREVLADLKYTTESWASFQKDLIGMQVRTVAENLEKLGKTILSSLREVKDVVPTDAMAKYEETVGELTEDMEKFGTNTYMGFWQGWLSGWKDLGADPDAARRIILPKTPSQFIDDYVPFSAQVDTLVSEKYWKELAYAGLDLLAKEIDDRVQEAYEGLHQKYSRFPLTVPKAGAKELTVDESAAAREAVMQVMGAAKLYDSRNIGGGARTRGFEWIDARLDRLCGLGLDATSRQWCLKAKAVLDGLPPKGEKFECVVRVLGKGDQPSGLSVLGMWAVLQIDQGKTQKGIRNINQSAVKDVGKIGFPSDELVFKFYRYPTDVEQKKVDRTKSISGAWGAMRLLHELKATRLPQQETKWHVELVIQDSEKRDRTLRLELEFPKPLPKLDQWP